MVHKDCGGLFTCRKEIKWGKEEGESVNLKTTFILDRMKDKTVETDSERKTEVLQEH